MSLRLDVTREQALERAAEIVAEGWASFDHARANEPPIDDRLKVLLEAALPEAPTSALEVLEDARRVLDESLAQTRPRYFAFVGSSGLEIGVLGDLLASCFDVNLAVWAAAATEVEDQAIRWVAEFVGFPAQGGAFTSGGTVSNMTALAAARERAIPGSRHHGLGSAQATLYCSSEAHYSIERAAEILGIGSANVRSLPIDGDRRLPPEAVRDAIRADRADGPRSRRGGGDGRNDAHRRRRSDRRARRRVRRGWASGCTWTAPTGCPLPRRRRPAISSPASTAPTRSRSTRTSGSTCRRRVACSSSATATT